MSVNFVLDNNNKCNETNKDWLFLRWSCGIRSDDSRLMAGDRTGKSRVSPALDISASLDIGPALDASPALDIRLVSTSKESVPSRELTEI